MPTPAGDGVSEDRGARGGGGHAGGGASRYCVACGYRVDNLPGERCPECGQGFDRADLLSTTRDGPLGFFGRLVVARRESLLRPTRWTVPLVVILAVVVSVESVLQIQPPWLFVVFHLLTGYAVIVALHLPRRAGQRALVRRHGLDASVLDTDRVRERRARLVLGGTAILLLLRAPLWVAFLISLPWLNQSARFEYEIRPANDPRPADVFVGLIPVRAVRCSGIAVSYELPVGGSLRYQPDEGGLHQRVDSSETHLLGPWYVSEYGRYAAFR